MFGLTSIYEEKNANSREKIIAQIMVFVGLVLVYNNESETI